MQTIFLKNSDIDFAKVMQIRNAVFETEQGAIAEEEIDSYDLDASTQYALIFDGDNAVATGRIAITPNGYKIGRIAVTRDNRKRGLGAILVNELCKRATQMGADSILVDAQLHAVGFYEKLGFSPTGDSEIIDRGIIHLPMRK